MFFPGQLTAAMKVVIAVECIFATKWPILYKSVWKYKYKFIMGMVGCGVALVNLLVTPFPLLAVLLLVQKNQWDYFFQSSRLTFCSFYKAATYFASDQLKKIKSNEEISSF